jgi:hypothetical protein
MSSFHFFFPVGSELGPVSADFFVGVQQAAGDAQERCEGGDSLRARPDACYGIFFSRFLTGLVCVAAPEVDDIFAVNVDAD